ncbi:MAG: hypothetical protein IJ733_11020, partial [Lachnospiraceae bacterium]|nr:hypothetical protein [Lachnospiraceae bacterium]
SQETASAVSLPPRRGGRGQGGASPLRVWAEPKIPQNVVGFHTKQRITEIFNNEFLKHDRIMAQEEFDFLISKSVSAKDV